MTRAPTGIPELDSRLDGGLPRPSVALLLSDNVSEKQQVAEFFAAHALRAGETCLYVDFYRLPSLARTSLRRFGDYDDAKLVFVDTTSHLFFQASLERYVVDRPDRLPAIEEMVLRAIRAERPARVVIDALDFLENFPAAAVTRFVDEISLAVREVGGLGLLLYTAWDGGLKDHLLQSADTILEFCVNTFGTAAANLVRVRPNLPHVPGTQWIPFAFRAEGGLVARAPRILVTGFRGSGKSTVLDQLGSGTLDHDLDRFGMGRMGFADVEAEVFGAPGEAGTAERFRLLARECDGVLVVLDATRPEQADAAADLLIGIDMPAVVLANKVDAAGDTAIEEVRKRLTKSGVPVVPCVATDGRGLREAYDALLERVVRHQGLFASAR